MRFKKIYRTRFQSDWLNIIYLSCLIRLFFYSRKAEGIKRKYAEINNKRALALRRPLVEQIRSLHRYSLYTVRATSATPEPFGSKKTWNLFGIDRHWGKVERFCFGPRDKSDLGCTKTAVEHISPKFTKRSPTGQFKLKTGNNWERYYLMSEKLSNLYFYATRHGVPGAEG